MNNPINSITIYKLFRKRKNGTLGSLFINAKAVIPFDQWMEAEAHFTPSFAYRPGWHGCYQPVAPHLKEEGRVWVECEAQDVVRYERPESQGGAWVLAKHLKVVRELSPEQVEEIRKSIK